MKFSLELIQVDRVNCFVCQYITLGKYTNYNIPPYLTNSTKLNQLLITFNSTLLTFIDDAIVMTLHDNEFHCYAIMFRVFKLHANRHFYIIYYTEDKYSSRYSNWLSSSNIFANINFKSKKKAMASMAGLIATQGEIYILDTGLNFIIIMSPHYNLVEDRA